MIHSGQKWYILDMSEMFRHASLCLRFAIHTKQWQKPTASCNIMLRFVSFRTLTAAASSSPLVRTLRSCVPLFSSFPNNNQSTFRQKHFIHRPSDARVASLPLFYPNHVRRLSNSSSKPPRNPAVAINKEIISLGKDRKWREMLSLYQEKSKQYNNVNYATTMSQLGRIRSLNKRDPSFLGFVKNLANLIEEKGLKWIGIRQLANIVHCIGKISLQSHDVNRIMSFVLQEDTAKLIVSKGKPQAVANICWSLAKQQIPLEDSAIFLRETEKRSAWLVQPSSLL